MAERDLKVFVAEAGGMVNAHVSLEPQRTPNPERRSFSKMTAFRYFVEMSDPLERMIDQGIKTFGICTPIDPSKGGVVIEAVEELKKRNPDVSIRTIGTFPRGILSRRNVRIFNGAATRVDVLCAHPSTDMSDRRKHIDTAMRKADELGKPLHVVVDHTDYRCRELEQVVETAKNIKMGPQVTIIDQGVYSAGWIIGREPLYQRLAERGVIWVSSGNGDVLPHSELQQMRPGVKVAIGGGNLWKSLQGMSSTELYSQEDLVASATVHGAASLGMAMRLVSLQPLERALLRV